VRALLIHQRADLAIPLDDSVLTGDQWIAQHDLLPGRSANGG
jgi:hypothetical protein